MDKYCTIYGTSMQIVNEEQVESATVKHNNVLCDFYPSNTKWSFAKNNQSIQYPDNTWEVILPLCCNDVKSWWTIELIDPNMWNMGKYIILPEPVAYNNLAGNIDTIVLQVTRADV